MAPPIVGGMACLLALGVALAWLFGGPWSSAPRIASATDQTLASSVGASQDGTASSSAPAVTSAGVDVEVPDVTGKPIRVAGALITAAGLTVQTRVAAPSAYAGSPEAVLAQTPVSGAKVGSGSVVLLTYQPQLGLAANGHRYVVVIDAGHQAVPDLTVEPDGPGSTAMKPKVSASAVGVSSGQRENALALAMAARLGDALSAAGVKVVMVRTTDDVNVSNSERARIANTARADLVVRIHASSSSDGTLNGITTYYPSGNAWVKPIESASHAAADGLESALVAGTGARKCGVLGRSDLAGFNYSTVPSVMVECGYLSNRDDDVRLATSAYRARVVTGFVTGILGYLRTR